MMREWAHCCDEAANHQLPIAAAFWIIQIVSRGMFKPNAKFDADSLLYSLSHFDVMTTQYTHSMGSTAPTD